MLSVVVLSHVVNDGVHRDCLLFLTLIVSFSFSLELLFTFYFSFFLELLFTFYFLELLYFFSFTYVLFLVSTRTSNPLPLPPFVSEALFCLCRGTNIYNFLGCVRISRHITRLYMLFTFSIFLSGFFILLVREKRRKTLYRFLLAKIKGWDKNNRDKNSERDKQITK